MLESGSKTPGTREPAPAVSTKVTRDLKDKHFKQFIAESMAGTSVVTIGIFTGTEIGGMDSILSGGVVLAGMALIADGTRRLFKSPLTR